MNHRRLDGKRRACQLGHVDVRSWQEGFMTISHMNIKVTTDTSMIIHTVPCVRVYTICTVARCTDQYRAVPVLLCVTLHCTTVVYCSVLWSIVYCVVACTVVQCTMQCNVQCIVQSCAELSKCLYRVLCGGDLSQHLPSPRQPHTPHNCTTAVYCSVLRCGLHCRAVYCAVMY